MSRIQRSSTNCCLYWIFTMCNKIRIINSNPPVHARRKHTNKIHCPVRRPRCPSLQKRIKLESKKVSEKIRQNSGVLDSYIMSFGGTAIQFASCVSTSRRATCRICLPLANWEKRGVCRNFEHFRDSVRLYSQSVANITSIPAQNDPNGI
jgi:hypothetical protein